MAKYSLNNIVRALRFPFVTASILPFIMGSLIPWPKFDLPKFILGLIAAISTHLSANLINDYADSKSGADWQDKRFYIFFGGSKLIQEKVFPESFFRNLAVFFFLIAAFSAIILSLLLKNISIILFFLFIIILAWSYSVKPLQFSYKRIGEFIIFILFGPALVMGGYFIQAGIFPTPEGFLLSLPFGFLTAAILYINEIPDFSEDIKVRKNTWISIFTPKNAFIGYFILVSCAFLSIIICIVWGYLNTASLVSLIFIIFAVKAGKIARNYYSDKIKLMDASKLTIAMHTLVSLVLIAGRFL